MIVLDYTSRIAPSALHAVGAIGVSRYLSWAANDWKVIHKSEFDELQSAGIQVTLNWENAANDWMFGQSAGASHANEAVRQAKALGYRSGSVIVGSCDFDITLTQWNATARYYAQQFAKTIRAGGYRPGVYGPWDVLEWVRMSGYMDAFWQAGMATAWSGGRNRNPWPGAHFRQRGHMTVAGHDTDWNDILIQPLWGKAASRMRDAVIYRDPRNGACVLRSGMFYYDNIANMAELSLIQALITVAGGDSTPKNVDAAAWDEMFKTGISILKLGNLTNETELTVTQEQINAAVAAIVPDLAVALASHIKVS